VHVEFRTSESASEAPRSKRKDSLKEQFPKELVRTSSREHIPFSAQDQVQGLPENLVIILDQCLDNGILDITL
jgi:hypothetical protein